MRYGSISLCMTIAGSKDHDSTIGNSICHFKQKRRAIRFSDTPAAGDDIRILVLDSCLKSGQGIFEELPGFHERKSAARRQCQGIGGFSRAMAVFVRIDVQPAYRPDVVDIVVLSEIMGMEAAVDHLNIRRSPRKGASQRKNCPLPSVAR